MEMLSNRPFPDTELKVTVHQMFLTWLTGCMESQRAGNVCSESGIRTPFVEPGIRVIQPFSQQFSPRLILRYLMQHNGRIMTLYRAIFKGQVIRNTHRGNLQCAEEPEEVKEGRMVLWIASPGA